MLSRKKRLQSSKLYVILDRSVNTYPELFEIAKKCIKLDVGVIQLRDKSGTAKEILEFSKKVLRLPHRKTLYVINDRIDLVMIAHADGVHLGQDDISVTAARKILGKDLIVGTSAQSLKQALVAQKMGADYIGFGSVFKTLTKPDRNPMDLKLLEQVFTRIMIPVFPIGGIDLESVAILKSLGCNRLAVCRAICKAKNIVKAIKDFQREISRG